METNIYTFLWLIGVLLQIVDGVTTYQIINLPGGYEKNPFVRWVMAKVGEIPGLILLKVSAALLMTLLYISSRPWILIPLVVLYFATAINNISVIKKIKSSQ